MASSEDEPDYMSEEFLNACVKDVRPGLVFKQSIKRRFQVEENQKASNEKHRKIQKPAKVLEIERREEGLSMAIATENKGFAMLQKMGFKPGQGLGKSGEGRTEPLAVEIKADRGGLGRDAAVKDVAQRKLELLKRRIASQSDETSLGAFRNRKKDEALQRINLADLNKSRRMCQALDEERNVTEPAEIWFWPERPKEPSLEEEATSQKAEAEVAEPEEDQLEVGEKLELLTSYLRQFHLYCIWCGTKFEDQHDLASNCPGSTRDDH